MSTVDDFLVPETLQGPYADFYRRAMTELFYWQLMRDGSDRREVNVQLESLDPLALDAIGIQLGEA